MNDLQRIEAIFISLGYEKIAFRDNIPYCIGPKEYYFSDETINDELYQALIFGDGIKDDLIFGYPTFGFQLVFNMEGKYIGHGAFR